jgi:hypothetical protein
LAVRDIFFWSDWFLFRAPVLGSPKECFIDVLRVSFTREGTGEAKMPSQGVVDYKQRYGKCLGDAADILV